MFFEYICLSLGLYSIRKKAKNINTLCPVIFDNTRMNL
ncbi:MAG: hypothetical protein BWX72_01830 [Firmicutes bacterium ADurb.Bin080]|nr:MAG: hypothetical protein BWX72_01830 [Firmicutes bacterium ADurb.Bin080]